MGDIAEMMLDGTLCQGCGVYMGKGDGYPVSCAACQRPERRRKKPHRKRQRKKKREAT
jgi:uncharacterized Zn finger protein (UPF0148 family)